MSQVRKEMMPIGLTAFVSGRGFASTGLSRRRRCAKCDCFGSSEKGLLAYSLVPRRTMLMQSGDSGDSEMARGGRPEDIESTRGFALRDAPAYAFADLPSRKEGFETGGAYAIRDQGGQICYMGYSKNIAAKLAFHEQLVPEKCASFQVYVPPVPVELISPEMLESVLEYWVRENGGVPTGNTVDRALWEQENPVERQPQTVAEGRDSYSEEDSDVPLRERTTPRRVANRRERPSDVYGEDAFEDNFRSSTGSAPRRHRKEKSGTWDAVDDDYVEVEVDPLDPFSASKKRRSTRSAWDYQAEDDDLEEDWIPIIALIGCAGLIWILGLLSNVLPAATPSLGM